MKTWLEIILFFFCLTLSPRWSFASEMVLVPAGTLVPFAKAKLNVPMPAFSIDRIPVTREEYRSFLRTHPEWLRSRIKPLFADSYYLSDWRSDLEPRRKSLALPVTWVSWFAANAYCKAQGKTLPSTDQWEYAAFDQGRQHERVIQQILTWYASPNRSKPLAPVGRGKANGFGIHDLFGLIWEWTLDFNDAIVDAGNNDAFCGNGAQGAADPNNYAAFMRQSFRASMKAAYTTGSLGFRCSKEGSAP